MEPRVTVVVPTFNRLRYLREALASVEAQTFREFELIVLDDGSSDGTREFLEDFSPGFPYRWYPYQRRERSVLRNEGVRLGNAALIAFLDDDDSWHPRKLERQVPLLERHAEVGLLFCQTVVVGPDGGALEAETREHRSLYRIQARRDITFTSLVERCMVFTSTVVVRRNVCEAVQGFDPSIALLEDLDFYLRVSNVASIAGLYEELVNYRLHPGGSASRLGEARMHLNEQWLQRLSPSDVRGRLFRLSTAETLYCARRRREAALLVTSLLAESKRFFLNSRRAWLAFRILVRAALELPS